MRLTAAQIMEALAEAGPVLLKGGPEKSFSGVTTDSRTAAPGQFFVPLVGDRFDGHEFIARAFEAGAAGTLIDTDHEPDPEWPKGAVIIRVRDTLLGLGLMARHWRSGLEAQVLAVSGSMGKSTVKEMAAEILATRYRVHKNQGNFNNLIGLPLTLLGVEPEVERVVVELGINQIGEMERLADIARPDAALLTNIGPVHLEGLGGLEGVIRAKTELWRRLGPEGVALVNLDDEVLKDQAEKLGCQRLTFGTVESNPTADVVLRRNRPHSEGGLHLVLEIGGKVCETILPAMGLFQGINATAAAAGAYALGAGLDEICGGLAEFRPISHRMRLVKGRDGLAILDDAYNANPRAMEEALETLVQTTPVEGRSMAVLGQMAELGQDAPQAHQTLGRTVARKGLDLLLCLGPFADTVVRAAREAGVKEAREVADREEAAELIQDRCRPGDLVLIKGSRVARLEDLVALLVEDGDEA